MHFNMFLKQYKYLNITYNKIKEFKIYNKTVALLAKRNSGKSSLLQYLVSAKKHQ